MDLVGYIIIVATLGRKEGQISGYKVSIMCRLLALGLTSTVQGESLSGADKK